MLVIILLLLGISINNVEVPLLLLQKKTKERVAIKKRIISDEERQKRQSLEDIREYSNTLDRYNHTISSSFIDPDSLFPIWINMNEKLIKLLIEMKIEPLKPVGAQFEGSLIIPRNYFYAYGIYEVAYPEETGASFIQGFSILRDFAAKFHYQEWYLYLTLRQSGQHLSEYGAEGSLNLKNITTDLITAEDYVLNFPGGAHLSEVKEIQAKLYDLFQFPFESQGWDNWPIRKSYVKRRTRNMLNLFEI
jgi:hypothetical protein